MPKFCVLTFVSHLVQICFGEFFYVLHSEYVFFLCAWALSAKGHIIHASLPYRKKRCGLFRSYVDFVFFLVFFLRVRAQRDTMD